MRGKGPLTLVWFYTIRNKSLALKVEYQVKSLSKAEKEYLIISSRTCLDSALVDINNKLKDLTRLS